MLNDSPPLTPAGDMRTQTDARQRRQGSTSAPPLEDAEKTLLVSCVITGRCADITGGRISPLRSKNQTRGVYLWDRRLVLHRNVLPADVKLSPTYRLRAEALVEVGVKRAGPNLLDHFSFLIWFFFFFLHFSHNRPKTSVFN